MRIVSNFDLDVKVSYNQNRYDLMNIFSFFFFFNLFRHKTMRVVESNGNKYTGIDTKLFYSIYLGLFFSTRFNSQIKL